MSRAPLVDLEHRVRMLEAETLNQRNSPTWDSRAAAKAQVFALEAAHLLEKHNCKNLAELDALIGRLWKALKEASERGAKESIPWSHMDMRSP